MGRLVLAIVCAVAQAGAAGTAHARRLQGSLQEAAEQVLSETRAPYAAIVVVHVPDARVLALAGRSRSEPGLTAEALALEPWAPAASVFKLITAAALLDGRKLAPDARVCYHGGSHGIERIHLLDLRALDRDCETLSYAIAHSQNAIVAKLAHRLLDPALLEKYAAAFGFGRDLVYVRPLTPSIARLPAEPLEFARTAAGFWNVSLSPFHAALIANAIASDGWFRVPGETPRRAVDAAVARSLGAMMLGTTREGTARGAFHDGCRALPFEVAGKTGTLTRSAPYLSYSWFVGFAPAPDHPQIAFAVLVGNDERSHEKAAPLSRRLLESQAQLSLASAR